MRGDGGHRRPLILGAIGAPEPSPKSDGSAYIHKVRSMEQFDVIVVGGGSAGCALAGRLSANPRLTVLLIEAGEDFVPGREPASIRDPGARTLIRTRFFWPALAEGGGRPVFQARVMGEDRRSVGRGQGRDVRGG